MNIEAIKSKEIFSMVDFSQKRNLQCQSISIQVDKKIAISEQFNVITC